MIQLSDEQRVAHLLRRFGLGASEAEIDFYGAGGWKNAVDRLLNFEGRDEPVIYTDEFLKDQNGNMPPNPAPAQAMCYAWLLTTNRPLQAKMTLFWHDHFATSSEKVANGPAMAHHWETLKEHSVGKFSDLLLSISQDPSMLYWLDNIENVKGRPNENFAREIMELFTLGEGNYSEKDIQEAARAFTGWSYGFEVGRFVRPNRGQVPRQNSKYLFDRPNHDTDSKTVFGKTGSFSGEDVIEILCALPRTSTYITEKIWKWFVYPNPSKAVIEKHAKVFSESGLQIKALLRSIMLDEETYSERAIRKIVKNPVDFCVPPIRQVGLGAILSGQLKDYTAQDGQAGRVRLAVPAAVRRSTAAMGMELLTPPDVSGWPSMDQWISTSTMIERIKWADQVFGNQLLARVAVPAVGQVGQSPTQIVDGILSVLDVKLPTEKRQQLIDAAAAEIGRVATLRTLAPGVAKVVRLLFSTPEYQFM
ncbi:MAG: DUF1800 domain-containing protein [Fimbriimonadaceae bacterium]|nr:MAG: DUF1800 domain-containing protein [Fimbriimonadaceae bacterium]